jgi:hypothetical protein
MRMAQLRRTTMWLLVGVIIVSLGRTIAYALTGGTIASRLSEQAGGAQPAMVAAVSLSIAVGVSAVGLWLVATGLRERSRLQLEGWSQDPPTLGIAGVARRATLLSAATIVVFTIFESCLHFEEGLGFHGWHCIAGPVHQNAAPILIGLSLVAAAIVTAVDAMLAAGRRLVARLVLARRAVPPRTGRHALPSGAPLRARLLLRFTPARGPPLPA